MFFKLEANWRPNLGGVGFNQIGEDNKDWLEGPLGKEAKSTRCFVQIAH